MPLVYGTKPLPTHPPLPPDYTPNRLIDWQGVMPEYYQDEWGVWHDQEGRPRPVSYGQAECVLRYPGDLPPLKTSRYTIPAGPWWYRLWIRCVVYVCG